MSVSRTHLARTYMGLVIAIAVLVVLCSVPRLSPGALGLPFLLTCAAAIGLGSRVTIRLPSLRAETTLTEVFIFLTMLLFDGEAAVLLAITEAFFSSFRISKKHLTRSFNASAIGCSTAASVWILRSLFGPLTEIARGDLSLRMVTAIFLMGLTQYVTNSVLVAIAAALRDGGSFWTIWRQYNLWASLPCLASSAAALITDRVIGSVGFYGLVITAPIVLVIYAAYESQRRSMQAVAAQAELAKRHIVELQESEERFRSAFDNATIGMALASVEGRWLLVNRVLCAFLGLSEEDFSRTDLQSLLHQSDATPFLSNAGLVARGEIASHQAEVRFRHRLGDVLWAIVGVARIRDPKNRSVQLCLQIQDVTARKRAEFQLQHDALHDSLTGLPNRALFMDHLKLALDRCRRTSNRSFAVLVLCLDRFKMVNDSLGHAVGDQLLIAIAHQLQAAMRFGDTLARLGGDEFAILLEEITDMRGAITISDRLTHLLSQPVLLGRHELSTTITTGIAPGGPEYENAEDILRDADAALSRAKAGGNSRREIYDGAMHSRTMHLLQLETDLRKAVERKEFFLQYQPIVSLRSGAIEGFEALVRWLHPSRGVVPPAEFIPLAEESDLILEIGSTALEEACRQIQIWRHAFPEHGPLTMSVNLSMAQCGHAQIVETVLDILKKTGCAPQALKLEITETVLTNNMNNVTASLVRLRDHGIESSIDDFGTGYSSLGYLHRFPSSTLKIDRSFVGGLSHEHDSLEIVRTIVTLARSLSMSVVAEGIETTHQLDQLRRLRCDQGQGYLFAKPLDAPAAEALLRSTPNFLALSEASDLPVELAYP